MMAAQLIDDDAPFYHYPGQTKLAHIGLMENALSLHTYNTVME